MSGICAKGGCFVDDRGRTLTLRGANLGGDCKRPSSRDPDLYRWKGVSFVGRPFPESEAAGHFDRIASWGLRFCRLLVTWEAIEHDGPGEYDLDYLAYVERLCELAGERGIGLFVDPHQDVWSRWTGGDGAPAWTLELAGFELARLHASGAAFLEEECDGPYPRMRWPTNYNRLACATMFTLFFAGDLFAPSLRIEGIDARSWLQGRYFDAIRLLARRLARFPNVHGFDTLNEPSDGFIGLSDPARLERAMARLGPVPTPLEAMAAGAGIRAECGVWAPKGFGTARVGSVPLGEEGVRAWKDGVDCIWAREGVWREEGGRAIVAKPGHFLEAAGRRVEFAADCLAPFAKRFARSACGLDAGLARRYLVFVEGVPNRPAPRLDPADPERSGARGFVNASHWYDGLTLYLKRWTGLLAAYDPEEESAALGPRAVRRYFRAHLRRWKERGLRDMGGLPTVIGEFGLPFDMNGARAFRNGDYSSHARALSEYYDALDECSLSAAIWNYTADNRHASGDGWNGEDLSVWNRDEAEAGRTETGRAIDVGGRAVSGFARPYASAVAGELVSMRYKRYALGFRAAFRVVWEPDRAIEAPTELIVPDAAFDGAFSVRCEGCVAELARDHGVSVVVARQRDGAMRCSIELVGAAPSSIGSAAMPKASPRRRR